MEQGAGGRCLDQLAGVHDPDAAAGLGHHTKVVSDQDDRRPRPRTQIAEQVQNPRGNRNVETGCRFVGDQKPGEVASAIAIITR